MGDLLFADDDGNLYAPNARLMLLTPPQLQDLTGLVRPSAQIRWLARNGWKFAVRADGRPSVSAREFERRMEGGTARQPVAYEPDFTVLHRAG
jgi:hypothetical protein